jgi:hypothetical protein
MIYTADNLYKLIGLDRVFLECAVDLFQIEEKETQLSLNLKSASIKKNRFLLSISLGHLSSASKECPLVAIKELRTELQKQNNTHPFS